MMSRPLYKPKLEQLMLYINEGKETFDEEPHFIIRYNTTGNNPKAIANDFRVNNTHIKKRKGRQIGVQHIILSWHPKEKRLLNDAKLFAFAQKFSEEMDFDRAITLGRVHNETSNTHLHFAVSASQFSSGKSRRISKAKLKEIQQEMNRFQKTKFPELKHSLLYLPELQKIKTTELGIPLPKMMRDTDGAVHTRKRGGQSQLESIRSTLMGLAKLYPNKDTFLAAIDEQEHIAVYHRNAVPQGIIMASGKKYRFNRLAIDPDNLKRAVRLYNLKNPPLQQDKKREQSKEKS